jgi:hypothetical protein
MKHLQDGGVHKKKPFRTGIKVNNYYALDLAQSKGEIKCRGMMDMEH